MILLAVITAFMFGLGFGVYIARDAERLWMNLDVPEWVNDGA